MPSYSKPPHGFSRVSLPKLRTNRGDGSATSRDTRWALLLRGAKRLGRASLQWGRSTAGGSFGAGIAAGLAAVALWHPLVSRFGNGVTFEAGVLAAGTVGLFVGAVASRNRKTASRIRPIVASALIVVWALAAGVLARVAALTSRSIDLDTLASPLVQAAVAFCVGLIVIGVPIACAAQLGLGKSLVRVGWLLSGGTVGSLTAVYIVGPSCGIQWAGSLAAVGCLLALASRAQRNVQPAESHRPSGPGLGRIIGAVFASVTVGLTAAALDRLTFQLFPTSVALQWSAVAGFVLGTAAGTVWSRHRSAGQFVLFGALCAALAVACFSTLTDWSLGTTASVSRLFLLMSIRGLSVALLLFPLGVAWGSLVVFCLRSTPWQPADDSRSSESPGTQLDALLRSAPALFAGYLTARWLLSRGVAVPTLVGGSALLLTLVGAGLSVRAALRWRGAGGLAAVLVLLILAGVYRTYDPARTARLLFSTNVFMERQAGTETRLLPFLDDGRLIATEEGDRGTYTLWKHHGVQFELRESGIPLGTFCSRPDLCPQFSGPVLTAALPLVLHEAPRHVLLLGLGSGNTLAACLEFPVADVTCVEGDGQLIGLLDRSVWPSSTTNPRHDNRVRIVELEPACAMQTRYGAYDVIVSDTDPAGVATGNPYFTREFYTGVAGQLAGDGIFAQRFRYLDFGAWPICSALATLKSAFTEVAAIEAGGGDLVLLATNSPRGLSRPELAKRFQAPQVSRTFAHIGWDWSVALNLGMYSGTACEELTRGARLNTASNGLFAYGLPQETMRWGAKREELLNTLNPHTGRIAEWPNVEGNDPEFLRRLSDVMLQRNLMTTYPDQPWAYRKAVREELKKHPHTVIEEAGDGYDRQLHPVDQRRLNYFAALGRAAHAAQPKAETLQELEEYAEPYDPVLTYFVHHELAALYARASSLDPALQLRHRLYTVYYGDASDRSIRDVVDALGLLVSAPQTLAAAERWDQMNALLQFLKLRWANRGLGKPPSAEIMLNDSQLSISAAESTLTEMEKLRSVVGISESDWSARREVIERSLVRPLRSYQAQLLPDYLKQTQPTATTENKPAVGTRQSAN